MKLTKNPVFLHYFSKFMGILSFVLKYMFIFLLLKMINTFSWPAKIMASLVLSFSSLPTSINSSRAFPMPIEPYVRLNMLRHWYPVGPTQISHRIILSHFFPRTIACLCLYSLSIIARCFFCHSLLFIFPIPLFNHLSLNISNFWFFFPDQGIAFSI